MAPSSPDGRSRRPRTATAAFHEIRAEAERSAGVLGFIVEGSRGKGLADEHSDYDLALIVREEAHQGYRERYADLPPGVDLGVFTLESFREHASMGTEFEWDRYNWTHLRADIDRTDGELQRLIDEKGRVPEESVTPYVSAALDWHVNQVYRSMKCLRAGDRLASHLEGAEGIRPFLRASFCLDRRRVAPYYKYLRWELTRSPLRGSSFGTGELLQLIETILQTGSPAAQQDLLRESERLGRANGFGRVFDAWTGRDRWAMTFAPP